MTHEPGDATPSARRTGSQPLRHDTGVGDSVTIRIPVASGVIVLRPWTQGDVVDVLAVYQDPDIARWDYLLPMRDSDQANR